MNYCEQYVTTNFSFLDGASHPEELVARAAELGHSAIAITDLHSFAGIIRAYVAAKDYGIRLIVGVRLHLYSSLESYGTDEYIEMLAYPTCKSSYGALSRLLTLGKSRGESADCILSIDDIGNIQERLCVTFLSPAVSKPYQYTNDDSKRFLKLAKKILSSLTDPTLASVALTRNYSQQDTRITRSIIKQAQALSLPLLAINNVRYHIPERKALADILCCIRNHTTLAGAGFLLEPNSEHCLKSTAEMARLFRDIPDALSRSTEIATHTKGFCLSQLSYQYPAEICPADQSPRQYLATRTWAGAKERYPEGIPDKIKKVLLDELELIHELQYEQYFLTCYDIVKFARSEGILCQGRGAAANSAVCFCLGITAVDPDQIDLLFARFVSKARNEPPDIDIDFEHERREEVIQYIYNKYGRHRAALTAAITTYRARSAIREVGKALGLSLDVVDTLAKALHRWTGCSLSKEDLLEMGLHMDEPAIWNTLIFCQQIQGFPRHLTQHVGGFIISDTPLSDIVPIVPATMEGRTMIEWDKDDIEVLGMLKIDVLALGMLTCVRKAIDLINRHYTQHFPEKLAFHSIPTEDPIVYDMLCKADTVGVFQIESRAQMSMLPRLKPRCFYDLVIEVAIVRPGPIHGDMVHPFLKRRNGEEKIEYPDEGVQEILGKTLGVPIFQEQAMRLSILLAGFTPDEAEALRRAMAAWKRNKNKIEAFQERINTGMLARGYSEEFAASCIGQLKGFSEYGFPESHAASFAHIVYASAWIKKHYPDVFAAALTNSQPMGFYAPAQILRDARAHGVSVRSLSINHSEWDCTIESPGVLRTGFRLVKGLREVDIQLIVSVRLEKGVFQSIEDLWQAIHKNPYLRISKKTLTAIARADAFACMKLSRRDALWQIHALPEQAAPIDLHIKGKARTVRLPSVSTQMAMFQDYAATGLSLRAHPMQFIRDSLQAEHVLTTRELQQLTQAGVSKHVSAAGIVLFKQRPGTSKGVVFLTLEDETGVFNVVVLPHIFEKYSKLLLSETALCVRGRLEKFETPVYICAFEINAISLSSNKVSEEVPPGRSWSY